MNIMKPIFAVEALDHEDSLGLNGLLVVRLLAVAIQIVKVVRVVVLGVFVFFVVEERARLEHAIVSTITPEIYPRIQLVAFMPLMASDHAPKAEAVFGDLEHVPYIFVVNLHDILGP